MLKHAFGTDKLTEVYSIINSFQCLFDRNSICFVCLYNWQKRLKLNLSTIITTQISDDYKKKKQNIVLLNTYEIDVDIDWLSIPETISSRHSFTTSKNHLLVSNVKQMQVHDSVKVVVVYIWNVRNSRGYI